MMTAAARKMSAAKPIIATTIDRRAGDGPAVPRSAVSGCCGVAAPLAGVITGRARWLPRRPARAPRAVRGAQDRGRAGDAVAFVPQDRPRGKRLGIQRRPGQIPPLFVLAANTTFEWKPVILTDWKERP